MDSILAQRVPKNRMGASGGQEDKRGLGEAGELGCRIEMIGRSVSVKGSKPQIMVI